MHLTSSLKGGNFSGRVFFALARAKHWEMWEEAGPGMMTKGWDNFLIYYGRIDKEADDFECSPDPII